METGHWTCVGLVKPELYSQSLRSLCKQTEWNQNRLKAVIEKTPRPKSAMEKTDDNFYNPFMAWEKKDVMFTNAEAVKNLGDNRTVGSDIDTDSIVSTKVPPTTFCYLCSTLEEHEKHHEKTFPKKARKPRIMFIAPPPRVRRKKEAKPSFMSTEALYKVEVFTADKPNASTDANVYISISGSEDILPKTKLHKKAGCARFVFGRSSREKFYIKGPKLGNLETLTIEHDGVEEKHSWFLEKVEVTDMATKDSWVFLCDKWLSLHIKDFKIKRHLKAAPKEVVKTDYKIIIHTGKKAFAGTDANVFITLYGEDRNSPKILLKDPTQKCFEKGCVDSFQVRLAELGKLKKIRIEHDGKGLAPGWFLDHVVIYKPSCPSLKCYCYCNSWLSRDEGGGRLWKELPVRNKPRTQLGHNGNKIKYEIQVKTGDVKYGGTDANVFIQMIGPDGVTSEIPLDDAKNNFERNMLDVFTVEADNVGSLEKILIGHDNSGVGAGWFLDKVCIRRFVPPKKEDRRMSRVVNSTRGQVKTWRTVQVDSSKELRELEDSESLGILERQILCELKAEADLIRREKWAVPLERQGSEDDLSDWSDGEDRYKGGQSSHIPDRSIKLSLGMTGRRRSSGKRRHSTAARRNRSNDPNQSESEEERSGQGRRASRVQQEGRIPVYEDYVFLCNQWLSADEGDKQIVRELVCQDKKVHYKD